MNFILSMMLIGAAIPVGPTRTVKDLSKIADGNEYVLDWQAAPYNFPAGTLTIKNSLILRSANPNARATVHFNSSWAALPDGRPNEGQVVADGRSINCYGVCTMKDLKTSGGEGVVIFDTQPGSTLLVQRVDMDGGGILRGSGAKSISIVNVQSNGRPTAYFIANFTNLVQEFDVDLTANTMPVQQGGQCVNKDPKCAKGVQYGEGPIRIMDTQHLVMKGVKVVPWLYDGVHVWKQTAQFRGMSGKYEVSGSTFHQASIGDIKDQAVPAHTLDEIDFTNCSFDIWADIDPGIKKIVYFNSKVGGVAAVNKSVTYITACPTSGTVAGCSIAVKSSLPCPKATSAAECSKVN